MLFGMFYRETTETVGVSQTTPVQFDRMMPKIAVALFTFVMTGANNSIAGTGPSRYQLSQDNEQTIDMTPSETRALFEYIYSRLGGSVPATSDLTWCWPFYLLALLAPKIDGGAYPEVGLPEGSDKVWRIQMSGSNTAGLATIGWKKAPNKITHSPLLVGRTLSGMTLSQECEFPIDTWKKAPVCGIIINGFAHVTRLKLIAADAEGNQVQLNDSLSDHILQVLQPYSAMSITDPLYIPFDVPTIFWKGSLIKFTLSASYDGTERIVPVQLVNERVAA